MSGARTLAGRYALVETIGRGGMATVYRGQDLVLGRTVAVKVLSAHPAEREPMSDARFQREARAAAAVSHRGIVSIFDSGVDGRERFIVMEHISGRSLASVLRERGRLPIGEALDMGAQIADALAGIHAAGLVHRDVKPSNAMIDDEGTVKLLDFGIALVPDAATLTQTSAVLGSAPYMAPEQARGERGGIGSDIYSLGCLIYELLDGAPPFTAENPAAVLYRHIHSEPPKLASAARLPAGLCALVMEMLAKSPEARPGSAAEVRDRIVGIGTPPARAVRAPTPKAAEAPRIKAALAGEAPTTQAALAGEAPRIQAALAGEAPTTQVTGATTARAGEDPTTKAAFRLRSPRRPALLVTLALAVCVAALAVGVTLSRGGGSNGPQLRSSSGGGSPASAKRPESRNMRSKDRSPSESGPSSGESAAREGEAVKQTPAADGKRLSTVTSSQDGSPTLTGSQGTPGPGATARHGSPLGHGAAPKPDVGTHGFGGGRPGHGVAPVDGGGPQKGAPLGHGGNRPGHGGTRPGQDGTPPGHGGTPPGHGGTPPGNEG